MGIKRQKICLKKLSMYDFYEQPLIKIKNSLYIYCLRSTKKSSEDKSSNLISL